MTVTQDVVGTLRAQEHGHQPLVAGFKAGQAAGSIGYQEEVSQTLQAGGSGLEPSVFDCRGNGNGDTAPTLTGDHQSRVSDYTAIVRTYTMRTFREYAESDHATTQTASQVSTLNNIVSFAQNSRDEVRYEGVNGQVSGALAASRGMKQQSYIMGQAKNVYGLGSNKNGYEEQSGALQAHHSGGATEFVADRTATIRRLTPLECERLQGFPDRWTDIGEWTDSKGRKRQTTDTARYRALGNSIALPFWAWLMRRISAQYERPATLGSLFDGLGGFPLVWATCNGPESCIWASEIEDYCVAVTKKHFGDGETEGDFYQAIRGWNLW